MNSSERDTMLIMRSLKNTSRAIKNTLTEQVALLESRHAGIEELASLISGQRTREVMETGDLECGIQTAGQVLGLIRNIPTAKELIDSIMSDAGQIISRISAQEIFQPLRTK